MKFRRVLAFALTVLLGSAMHYFYDWLPLPLVGLFAPINESVWEHLKLLFWPFLLISLLFGRKDIRYRGAVLLSALLMPVFLLSCYYVLSAGFGVKALALDIGLYVLSTALGYFLLSKWEKEPAMERALGLLIPLTALYAACLIAFSVAAPPLPVFTP